jgi:Fe-S cluster biogenesis protein NfuA
MLADNGNIKVVDVKGGDVVVVKWLGACASCSRSELTLRYSVKDFLIENMQGISDVVSV